MTKNLFLVVLVLFWAPIALIAQQAASPVVAPQTTQVILSSLLASGAIGVKDVSIQGTVTVIAGADNETGSVLIKALPGGFSRLELNLSSERRIETNAFANGTAIGTWTGDDGKSHAVANHNLQSGTDWFFPGFVLSRIVSQGYVVAYVGNEARNGANVAHFSAYPPKLSDVPTSVASLAQRLAAVDLFIDQTSLLPVAVSFNIHPDNDAATDIPVEVRFSGYQRVNGVQVPFRLQKFINNSLVTDIQIQSVVFNTGLSTVSFPVQ